MRAFMKAGSWVVDLVGTLLVASFFLVVVIPLLYLIEYLDDWS